MAHLDGTKKQFQQLVAHHTEGSLKMLNLLKFKKVVASSGKSGAEHYKDYMKAIQPYFSKANAKVIFFGAPQLNLIGPQELEWDKVLIVEYASKEDFLSMATDPDFPSQIRREALKDSRLIYCS